VIPSIEIYTLLAPEVRPLFSTRLWCEIRDRMSETSVNSKHFVWYLVRDQLRDLFQEAMDV
jgi:hypothetical protein